MATPPRQCGSTDRRGESCWRRSRMRSLATGCGTATESARSRRTRRGSFAMRGPSRRPSSRRSWISSRSSSRRPFGCPSVRSRSSWACSSATRRWTCSRKRGGSPRRACRRRRSTSSAAVRCARFHRRWRASFRSRRGGRSRSRRPRSRVHWTRRASSCFRRARRDSGAWSWRRSAVGAASSAAGSVGSQTSFRMASRESSWSLATRTPSRMLSSARSPIGSGLGELGAAAHAAVQPWLATPQEYARRIRELVDQVTA